MINSTKLSAKKHDKSTASAYQLFTNTIIRIFHEMNSQYIDIKGDGVFALYNSNQLHNSIAAAVTVKTFVEEEFNERFEGLDLGLHIGIDRKTLLVRKLGLMKRAGRTDKQNEVWAGKTVNMAAKLASMSKTGELIVSDRYYNQIKEDKVLKSCTCSTPTELWSTINLSGNNTFDFNKAYLLKSKWCSIHGKEYCKEIMNAD